MNLKVSISFKLYLRTFNTWQSVMFLFYLSEPLDLLMFHLLFFCTHQHLLEDHIYIRLQWKYFFHFNLTWHWTRGLSIEWLLRMVLAPPSFSIMSTYLSKKSPRKKKRKKKKGEKRFSKFKTIRIFISFFSPWKYAELVMLARVSPWEQVWVFLNTKQIFKESYKENHRWNINMLQVKHQYITNLY